ncbi:MAG: (2Fe-2S)-binding protein [Proteocatella sp.]
MYTVNFTLNGRKVSVEVSPVETLLSVVREKFNLTGAKEGCGQGECGACTMIVNGRPMTTCLILAIEAEGYEITTVEGLSTEDELDVIQEEFITHGALQCGYCTPGMIMSAKGLLMENTDPTEEEVVKALSGNLCRCTGYKKIVEATLAAAKRYQEKED